MIIGERLKSFRLSRGWTQKEVAQKLDLNNRETYTSYESNTRTPNIETVCKMAEVFGVTVDYLLGRSPEAPNGSVAPDPLLPQLLAHLTRIEQSMVEIRADIQELKEIAVAGAQLAERVDAHELDIKLIKKAITKE